MRRRKGEVGTLGVVAGRFSVGLPIFCWEREKKTEEGPVELGGCVSKRKRKRKYQRLKILTEVRIRGRNAPGEVAEGMERGTR